MITLRQLVRVAALCGAAVLAGSNIDKSAFEALTRRDTAMPARDWDAVPDATASGAGAAPSVISPSTEPVPSDEPQETVTGSLGKTVPPADTPTEMVSVEAPVDSRPTSPPETPVRLVSAFPSRATDDEPLPPVRPLEMTDECIAAETCIDDYLWALYERTPKVDTNKVVTRTKKAVKKDGKVRTIIAAITNYVIGDFTWKDPAAAEKASIPLKEYVIGGMDAGFKLKLFRALRTLDAAGFMPGITSAFRDDYRQSIADGNKAASDSSYHGGSRRGGFGHGLAADLVSVKGETRKERLASSDALWKWIDAHEKELGIGRPYRDRDPPHVGPLDGKEYADKRAAALKAAEKAKAAKTAKAEPKKKPAPPARHDAGTTKRASAEKSAKVSSLQTTLATER